MDACKLEPGNLEAVKGRTDEESLTAWRTWTLKKQVGEEVGERRHDGSPSKAETACPQDSPKGGEARQP